jgi:predicted metal-binding membrane protein
VSAPGLAGLLSRERLVTAAGLAVLVALAWLYLVRTGREMAAMAAMGMAAVPPWTPVDAALAAVMWAVMMIAMMIPTAAPMILVFAAVDRRRRSGPQATAATTPAFVAGYLAVWTGFSAAAAAAQWGLQAAALLSEDAMTVTPAVGAGLVAAAGLYQLTPLKRACLARCRSPLGFLLSEWRDGRRGALAMGLRHGVVCLGCCWVLMALLFVGGVMNLAWVAVLALFVLVEKVAPGGRVISVGSGLLLLAWAAWLVRAAV